jgi:putative mRNA 3-end processing factor
MKLTNANWLIKKKEGLYCIPGDFYIDPLYPVKKALITHAHTDHARPNNHLILGTKQTIEIMKIRYAKSYCTNYQVINYNSPLTINNIDITFIPAGHILGSSQILIEYNGCKVLISGDYKRVEDKTCESYQNKKCDIFITEATFGLPIFSHPFDKDEIKKLLDSVIKINQKPHLIGVYALGKCQRILSLLRDAGYDETIYLHGALMKITDYYVSEGLRIGKVKNTSDLNLSELKNQIILCPPSALHDKWSRKFKNPIKGIVSGWMNIRQRIKQKNIQLPLIISDHADWNDILLTTKENNPEKVLVTHGREEALVFQLNKLGYDAKALNLLGYEDEYE